MCWLPFLLFLVLNISTKAAYTDFKFKDITSLENGLAFPSFIETTENQIIHIELLKTSNDQKHCLLTSPSLETINVDVPKNFKFTKGNSACSVKINNLRVKDTGRWKLQSINDESKTEAIASILVKNASSHSPPATITLVEGAENITVEFYNKETSYCSLLRDDIKQATFIDGKCVLPVNKVTKNLNGNWKIKAGLRDQIEEVILETSVNVKVEDVEMGLMENTFEKNAKLYCNLKNSAKTVVFCRFERMSDGEGFNLIDGLGNDRYQYYGSGLNHKECGILIKNIQNEDYGVWKCHIGTELSDGKSEIITRLLQFNKPANRIVSEPEPSNNFLAVKKETLHIKCFARQSLSYCRFTHPSGTEFLPATKTADSTYWYDEESLMSGECSFYLKEANDEDSGIWTCSMGSIQSVGLELIQKIRVRVTGPLAAIEPNVKVKYGESATLRCQTSGSRQALKYCRFTLPDKTGFNINSDVNIDNAILNNYYYPKNITLHTGDCSVTIKTVSEEHFGEWICAAMIDGQHEEYMDHIILEPIDSRLSAASVTGIAIGAIIVCGILAVVGYTTWKKRKIVHNPLATTASATPRTTVTSSETVVHFRPSGESDTSTAELTFSPEIQGTSFYGSASKSSHQS